MQLFEQQAPFPEHTLPSAMQAVSHRSKKELQVKPGQQVTPPLAQPVAPRPPQVGAVAHDPFRQLPEQQGVPLLLQLLPSARQPPQPESGTHCQSCAQPNGLQVRTCSSCVRGLQPPPPHNWPIPQLPQLQPGGTGGGPLGMHWPLMQLLEQQSLFLEQGHQGPPQFPQIPDPPLPQEPEQH